MKERIIKISKSLFARMNRGILLDIGIFVLNIFLMRVLTGNFIELTRTPNEDVLAKIAVALFFTGLLFLAPLGAILKRHQFWERIEAQDRKDQIAKNITGFIFHPTFCVIWMMIVYALVVISWHQVLLRDSYLSSTVGILAIFFGGFVYCFVGAFIISKFYEDDYDKPFWNFRGRDYVDDFLNLFDRPFFERFYDFLETPLSAALGDLCIYLNMICFQIIWGYLVIKPFSLKSDGSETFSAILFYFLMLLLFYFPPRNFYLAEDIHRPLVWLTIFFANLPSFLYLFFQIRIF